MRFLIILSMMFLCLPLSAADEKLGVGAMIGNPTGLNGKYWLKGEQAVDGGFAFAMGKRNDLSIHSDYLFHSEGALYFNDDYPLDLYYGVGGRMEFADSIDIGLRLPVGVAHKFSNQPSDVFAEIAPIIDFIGRSGIDLHLAFGGRFYF